jgi:putative membrane protein
MPRPSSRTHARLHFRVRPLLLRFLANALSLALTAIIVPHVFFAGDYRILSWLLISVIFGLLNAFLKPLLQILMLPLIFVSYGLVVVVINTCLLYALAWIFPQRFHVEHVLWALVGGLVCGLLEGLFQNLLGLSPPILEGGPDTVSDEIARRKDGTLEARMLAAAGAAAGERPSDAAVDDVTDGPEGGRA